MGSCSCESVESLTMKSCCLACKGSNVSHSSPCSLRLVELVNEFYSRDHVLVRDLLLLSRSFFQPLLKPPTTTSSVRTPATPRPSRRRWLRLDRRQLSRQRRRPLGVLRPSRCRASWTGYESKVFYVSLQLEIK